MKEGEEEKLIARERKEGKRQTKNKWKRKKKVGEKK